MKHIQNYSVRKPFYSRVAVVQYSLATLQQITSSETSSVVVDEARRFFLKFSFLLHKISQIRSKITFKISTFTSTNKKHRFITSIIRSNMNQGNSQRIYNIKQGRTYHQECPLPSQNRRRKSLQRNH